MEEPTMTTINGGEEIKVMFKNGEKEFVKVRELPVALMEKYAQCIASDTASVELYCDKPEGWSDTLTRESFSAVADLGLELNRVFFGGWLRRRLKISETINPEGSEKIQKAFRDATANAAPPTISSPSLASSPELRVGAA